MVAGRASYPDQDMIILFGRIVNGCREIPVLFGEQTESRQRTARLPCGAGCPQRGDFDTIGRNGAAGED
jgi:hypothetical protein